MRAPSIIAALLLLAAPGASRAGGLYLNEFGTTSMGTSGASAQSWANDASTAFHNPAGMTRLEGNHLMASAGVLFGDVRFDQAANTPVAGGNGGQQGGPGPILGAYYVHDLLDRIKVGASLISISAAILDPKNTWTGRYQVQDVSLVTLSLQPSIGVRLTDWLSLGLAGQVLYGTMNMKVAVPNPIPALQDGQVELEGLDDWGLAVGASFLLEPTESTRIGAAWFSGVDLKLSGDVKFQGAFAQAQTALDTEVPLVQFVQASVYHDLSERFAVMGQFGWENWSTFDEQWVTTTAGGISIPRNWDDTYSVALGFHYRPTERWLFQIGGKFDTSPTDPKDRTADLPLDQQIRASVGVQWDKSERVKIGGAFTYANYGEAEIFSPGPLGLIGDYSSNNLFFFALHFAWRSEPKS
jgi:long-chain fatty acid transport protein